MEPRASDTPLDQEKTEQEARDKKKFRRSKNRELEKQTVIASGKKFIKVFQELLDKGATKEDRFTYMQRVLHAIFFYGHVNRPQIKPEEFIPTKSWDKFKQKFQKPIEEYNTHFPPQTPYSILLEYITRAHSGQHESVGENPGNLEEPKNLEKQENSEKLKELENPEKQENSEKLENWEKRENPEEPEKLKELEKQEKSEKLENPGNLENSEKMEDPEEPENLEKWDNPEKLQKLENPEKKEKLEKPDNPGKLEEPEQLEYPGRLEQLENPAEILENSRIPEELEKLEQINKQLFDMAKIPAKDFALSATVIAHSSFKDPNNPNMVTSAYGASIAYKGKEARRIMIAISALFVWDKVISYEVSCGKDGQGIRFPTDVNCKAYGFEAESHKYECVPPCANCNRMFLVKFDPTCVDANKVEPWPYGNCAETESLSNLIRNHDSIRDKLSTRDNNRYLSRDDIINKFKTQHEDKLWKEIHRFMPHVPKVTKNTCKLFTPAAYTQPEELNPTPLN